MSSLPQVTIFPFPYLTVAGLTVTVSKIFISHHALLLEGVTWLILAREIKHESQEEMPGTTLRERSEPFFGFSSASCSMERACDAEAQAAMLDHEEKATCWRWQSLKKEGTQVIDMCH